MDGLMHELIVKAAANWLDGAAAELWRPQLKSLEQASNYPDYFAAGENSKAENRALEPDWREYTIVMDADGAPSPAHAMTKSQELRGTFTDIIRVWNSKTLDALAVGQLERAAKFAGCLSHLVGDAGQTAHLFDERLVKRLFPQGDRLFVIHSAIERVHGTIVQTSHRSRLLGASLPELTWRLVEELELLQRREAAELAPIMQALLAQDQAAAKASASRTVTHCAELFTDVLFSLWAISCGETTAMATDLDLRSLIPLKENCDMLFNFGIVLDRAPGKNMDSTLPLDPGLGRAIPGIALLANMAPNFKGVRETSVEYLIPSGVFQNVECLAGLNHNQENQTDAIFEVRLDGRTVFRSGALGQNDAAVAVKVKLGSASTIEFYARDVRNAPCCTKFFYPVFAAPKLTGRNDAN